MLLEKVLAEDALPVGSLATPVLQIALPAQTALAEVEAELVQNTVALVCVDGWVGGCITRNTHIHTYTQKAHDPHTRQNKHKKKTHRDIYTTHT